MPLHPREAAAKLPIGYPKPHGTWATVCGWKFAKSLKRFSWPQTCPAKRTSALSARTFWRGATSSWEVWQWRKCWAICSTMPVEDDNGWHWLCPPAWSAGSQATTKSLRALAIGGCVGKHQAKRNVWGFWRRVNAFRLGLHSNRSSWDW